MLRSRREVLGAIVLAATGLLFARSDARATLLPSARSVRRSRGGRGLGVDAGIETGDRFASCVVTGLGPTAMGAIPIRLRDPRGRSFTVDLLRHDPETPGVARAGSLDAFVSNDGDGISATEEEHGLAAMAIAARLSAREAAGAVAPPLLTLRERAELRRRARARA